MNTNPERIFTYFDYLQILYLLAKKNLLTKNIQSELNGIFDDLTQNNQFFISNIQLSNFFDNKEDPSAQNFVHILKKLKQQYPDSFSNYSLELMNPTSKSYDICLVQSLEPIHIFTSLRSNFSTPDPNNKPVLS